MTNQYLGYWTAVAIVFIIGLFMSFTMIHCDLTRINNSIISSSV